ncbi:MAG: hypothetical protein HY286_17745 [Planctomycetes bacterium]|nr:hypothetical protein [Planctomycetota bacterium]
MASLDHGVAIDSRRDAPVESRLANLARAARRLYILRGALSASLGIAAFIIITLIADRMLRLGSGTRAGIMAGAAAALVVFIILQIRALRRIGADPLEFAASLDTVVRGERDRAVQALATLYSLDSAEGSPALREAAVRGAREKLQSLPLEACLDRRGGGRRSIQIAAAVAALAGAAWLAPQTASIWLRRWCALSTIPWPQDTWLEIQGLQNGKLWVPAREAFSLHVSVREGSAVPDAVDVMYQLDESSESRAPLARAGESLFEGELPPVAKRGFLWLRGGDDRVGPIVIETRNRPSIESFDLKTSAPNADKFESIQFTTQDEEVRLLPGTRVRLSARADEEIDDLKISGSTPADFGARQTGEREWEMQWTHRAVCAITLEARSKATGLVSKPRSLTFEILKDSVPRVALQCLKIGERVSPAAKFPCRVEARDDFGLTSLTLEILPGALESAPAEPYKKMELATSAPGEMREQMSVERELELLPLHLAPGTSIHLAASAADNCRTGPQVGRSRDRVLLIVSSEQLLREILARLQAARGRLRVAQTDCREIRDSLGTNPDPATIVKNLQRLRVDERNALSVLRTVESGLGELSCNALIEDGARKQLEKDVLERLDGLTQHQLPEQRVALETATREGLAAGALSTIASRQETIVKEITHILNAMNQWDSFVDLVSHLDEVIQMQTDARKAVHTAMDRGGAASKPGSDKK